MSLPVLTRPYPDSPSLTRPHPSPPVLTWALWWFPRRTLRRPPITPPLLANHPASHQEVIKDTTPGTWAGEAAAGPPRLQSLLSFMLFCSDGSFAGTHRQLFLIPRLQSLSDTALVPCCRCFVPAAVLGATNSTVQRCFLPTVHGREHFRHCTLPYDRPILPVDHCLPRPHTTHSCPPSFT